MQDLKQKLQPYIFAPELRPLYNKSPRRCVMDKSERLKLLDALYFGKPDAESEGRMTTDVFVVPPQYPRVVDYEVGLILGNKGIGKTAIREYLDCAKNDIGKIFLNFDSNRDVKKVITCVSRLNHELRLNLEARKSLGDIDKDSRGRFSSEWLSYLSKKIVVALLHEEIIPKKSYIRKKYEPPKTIFDRIKSVLPKKISAGWSPPEDTGKYEVTIDFGEGSKEDEEIDFQDILNQCNELLREKDYYIWVLIDDIDDLFFPNLKRRDTCIASLLELWESFYNAYTNIRLKIFARNDIFRALAFVGKPKLYGKFVVLGWNRHSILHLIDRRILNVQSVRTYCERILSKSLSDVETMTEEEALKVFYTIFEQNSDRSKSGQEFLISSRSVFKTLEKLRRYRLETYLVEFKEPDKLNWYKKIRKLMHEQQNEFSREYLANVLEVDNKEELNPLLEIFFDRGLLRPMDEFDVEYATKFELPYMYRTSSNDADGNVFEWLYDRASDAQGILPRELIFILNEAKNEELKLLRR
jgi:hypothetical protein